MNKEFEQKVWLTVSNIPQGTVASYGQIAKLIGQPNHSRHVGKALKALDKKSTIPWHRVVNGQGFISVSKDSPSYQQQQTCLIEEGVPCSNGRVNMKRHQWAP